MRIKDLMEHLQRIEEAGGVYIEVVDEGDIWLTNDLPCLIVLDQFRRDAAYIYDNGFKFVK